MAAKLENILITIGAGADSVSFVVRGTLKNYEDVAAVPDIGFTALAADANGFKLTEGVITPVTALLESGNFKRVKASDSTGKRTRTFVIPVKGAVALESAIKSAGGLSIDGVTCTSLSKGLRRVSR